MLFSLDWLLALCPAERNVGRIAEILTARGLTVDSLGESGTDTVLDIDVAANRPDCLGHLGVARELAAALGTPLSPPRSLPKPAGAPVDERIRVEIEDTALCPRYTATIVRGVKLAASPDWVQRRLVSCGLRPVTNVVDVSNLVLLELGQPVHFFDLDRVGGTILVRGARPGERLRTLDGQDRVLAAGMLLIAEPERALALAGVMGGAATEIAERTVDVLIEAARFKPTSIRATTRRLGLQTDASYRFERDGDPQGPLAAQELAASLLFELAGGRPAPGLIDVGPGEGEIEELLLHTGEIRRLLGFDPGRGPIRDALAALGLTPVDVDESSFRVTVPTYRLDLSRETDLVEEVARHIGYDRIPAVVSGLPSGPEPTGGDAASDPEEQSRDILAHLGFHEALGYAMIAPGEDDRFVPGTAEPPLVLTNPLADRMAVLRRSVLPGLLRAVDLNLRRGNRDVRLFEIGRVFVNRGHGLFPQEPLHLALAWSGSKGPGHWSRELCPIDLYDLMGVVERVLDGLRPGSSWSRHPATLPALHPLQSATWRTPAGRDLAWAGALHPDLQESIEGPTFVAEVDLTTVADLSVRPALHTPLSRLPAVTRDLSLVLGVGLTYSGVLETLRGIEPPAAVEFEAVDRYEGPPLAAGQVSLTVRLTLRPHDRTLTDPETERYREALIGRLREELGVEIRV